MYVLFLLERDIQNKKKNLCKIKYCDKKSICILFSFLPLIASSRQLQLLPFHMHIVYTQELLLFLEISINLNVLDDSGDWRIQA